ncbi:hypothetical protein ACFLRZ_05680, partial [Bacteroidota bacterium]
MKFKIGDKVKFLNQKGEGVISKIINSNLVNVMIEDGFEIPTVANELVKIANGSTENTKDTTIESFTHVDENPQNETSIPLNHNHDNKSEEGIYLAFIPHD